MNVVLSVELFDVNFFFLSVGYVIVKLTSSLGSDGHTIALADSGEVFSWGDGDYGKKLASLSILNGVKQKQTIATVHTSFCFLLTDVIS